MRVVAGCDGGGSKCTVRVAVLQDGLQVRQGQATTGPANVRSDPVVALENICQALRQATIAAELPEDHAVDHCVAALAGAGTGEIQQAWGEKLALQSNIVRATVIPDVMAIFAAVDLPLEIPTIATVVGTGSIAWGRHSDGRMLRAGGLGPESGDEGSGYWIAREALEGCRQAGSSPLGMQLEQDLSEANSDLRPHELARLAPVVFEFRDRDAIARKTIESAARHIARLVVQVARELKVSAETELHWICTGGVAVHQTAWLERIRQLCGTQQVALQRAVCIPEPVAGALQIALSESVA